MQITVEYFWPIRLSPEICVCTRAHLPVALNFFENIPQNQTKLKIEILTYFPILELHAPDLTKPVIN